MNRGGNCHFGSNNGCVNYQLYNDTVDGINPAPVHVVVYPIGFINPRWLAGFLPSTVLFCVFFCLQYTKTSIYPYRPPNTS